MKSRNASRILLTFVMALAIAVPTFGITGSIFTTDSTCSGVNINIFDSKDDVYLNGGPNSPSAPGLPDGDYYARVTDPSGAIVLGKTLTASVTVTGGAFAQCYQLVAILYSGASGFTSLGYDDTPSNGGEYKVWVSKDATFPGGDTKTDNFKVEPCEGQDCEEQPPQGTINVIKFY